MTPTVGPRRRLRATLAGFGMLAALLPFATTARAHIVNDREAKVLARIAEPAPSAIAALPDSAGWCAGNRRGDFAVARQIPALRALAWAAARGDTAGAERGWSAIDAAFTLQRPGGRFERFQGGVPTDTTRVWTEDVRWLAELNRTLAVVMNGPLRSRFQMRWSLLRMKLLRSMNGLVDQALTLESRFRTDPAGMLTVAEAFLLADGHYHDSNYGLAGQRAMVAGLKAQRADGTFGAPGAAGWATDAACLDAIEALDLYFPGPFFERASDRLAPKLEARLKAGAKSSAHREAAALTRRALEIREGRQALGPPNKPEPHGEMFGK